MSATIPPATIRLNGQDTPLTTASLTGLLAGLGLDEASRGVAVALNGAVVPRRRWPDTALAPGDVLDIVRPIQGG
ncbi:sulfur carrier protein ThiS [Azospirillum griseum]|uniref:Sulfur carrier protein ThiS n=1 Tax=Azospirillum griseum TaxID=2496639 RepID=A0A3S0JI73_9PROT|nr:sulfur carrier protein ThiS [Azospirillum griseum]RTR19897.1 sulfur carrier protein ThiS [Azospirillum griseum]